MPSAEYMQTIRDFDVPEEGLAIWTLGQNSFILKSSTGQVVSIDPYLTDHCTVLYPDFPFRLHRQLPIFIEPEDLDVDLVLFTHSHADHFDLATIERLQIKTSAMFIGPWEAYARFEDVGIPASQGHLIHANQEIEVDGLRIRGTFALPTDATDLNHIGYVLTFANGITFYNSGDTRYTDLLEYLEAFQLDICSICMNTGFNNLSYMEAAKLVTRIQPKVVIPFHHDLMVDNVGNPDMFRVFLEVLGCKSTFQLLPYYKPWVYEKTVVS